MLITCFLLPILGSFSGYLTMINESCCGECVAAGDALLSELFLNGLTILQTTFPMLDLEEGFILENRQYNDLSNLYLSLL